MTASDEHGTSLRMVKVSTLYPEFADAMAAWAADGCSHAELMDEFVRRRYGWSDYYTRRLRDRGWWAQEIVAAPAFQRAWASDRGVAHLAPDEALLRQVVEAEPDVVVLQDLYTLDAGVRAELRRRVRGVRLVGWRAAPTQDHAALSDLDLLLSSSPSMVERFRAAGVNARHLAHGFAPEVINELRSFPPIEVSFVGSLGHWDSPHRDRYLMLERLVAETPIQLYGRVTPPAWASRPWLRRGVAAAGMLDRVTGGRIPLPRRLADKVALGGRDPLRPPIHEAHPGRVHPPVFGLDYLGVLAATRVSLNLHIAATMGDAANMRLFEATGVGTCLVTDATAGLERYFVPDEEVVVFASMDECRAKVLELLESPSLRATIAAAGQARTLADHTFDTRAARLDALLREVIS